MWCFKIINKRGDINSEKKKDIKGILKFWLWKHQYQKNYDKINLIILRMITNDNWSWLYSSSKDKGVAIKASTNIQSFVFFYFCFSSFSLYLLIYFWTKSVIHSDICWKFFLVSLNLFCQDLSDDTSVVVIKTSMCYHIFFLPYNCLLVFRGRVWSTPIIFGDLILVSSDSSCWNIFNSTNDIIISVLICFRDFFLLMSPYYNLCMSI